MSAAITVESISSCYGEFQILDGVSFAVERGTIHGLIGPNGAGKSTLLDVMTGSHPPSRGRVLFDGVDTSRTAPHRVARMGLRRTFQHPRLCWSWTLLENVMIGAAVAGKSAAQKADLAQAALQRLGLGGQSMQRADRVDGVTQLKAQIARCLVSQPRVLVLDEPSAGMDRRQRNQLSDLLLSLAHEGMTILLVAHDLPLVRACTAMLSVINSGKLIAYAPTDQALDDTHVRAAYLGFSSMDSVQPALAVDSLVIEYHRGMPVVNGASFEVRPAEMVGLFGRNGAGKSTTLRAVFGMVRRREGAIRVLGHAIDARAKPHDVVRLGATMVIEGRGIFADLSVEENLRVASGAKWRADASEVFDRFPMLAKRRTTAAGRLSGGEQQLLAIARAALLKPSLLVVDEPSLGLSPSATQFVLATLRDMAAHGTAVLIADQNVNAVGPVCDRAVVMEAGMVAMHLTRAELDANPERVENIYLGRE